MWIAEHPTLGSVHKALLKSKSTPDTVEHKQPTPILIKGVERHYQIAANPDPNLSMFHMAQHGLEPE